MVDESVPAPLDAGLPMGAGLPAPIGAGAYNVYTGEQSGGQVPTAARLGLEPPRFCAECGRRMIVQVRPDGWWAQCSRHGRVDSADLETQR